MRLVKPIREERGNKMSWTSILKRPRQMGVRFKVDGKNYQLMDEQLQELKREMKDPYLQGNNKDRIKRIALRRVIRKFGLQPKSF